MKITLKWLQKYLPELAINPISEFHHKLDTRLTEIEEILAKGESLSKIYVAEIVSCENHPQSDHLKLCSVKVFTDQEPIEVVCGAPNAKDGLKVVYCLAGGSVVSPKDSTRLEIGTREIMGVVSNGMICSSAELGLGTDHSGIMELPANSPIGIEVTELFRDNVIDIQNKSIPHRSDAFSHIGIARELSAIFKTEFQSATNDLNLEVTADDILPLTVNIQPETQCRRFSAVVVSGVKIDKSPLWMQIQLLYCGVRPINNVVDVTNYVMLDLGQPLHAFDYDRIDGAELNVRKAKKNELLTTLDGKERNLETDMIVVADKSKAQSLAGIMGGAESEITDQTTRIVIEAANWEMFNIRTTSRKLGLRSEASLRFEKGLTPTITTLGVATAANLIKDLTGGEIASELIDIFAAEVSPLTIKINTANIKRLIGIELDKAKLNEILNSIGITITNLNQIPAEALSRNEISVDLELLIPEYRTDLHGPEDILEEIARLYGYENINQSLPEKTIAPTPINHSVRLVNELKDEMVKAGFTEILTYAMVGAEIYENAQLEVKDLVKIKNPISPELSFIRNQLLPSVLSKVNINLVSGYSEFGLFELDKVVINEKLESAGSEVKKLAGVYVSDNEDKSLNVVHNAISFISSRLGLPIAFEQSASAANYLHPRKAGLLKFNGEQIGVLGLLHPQVMRNFNIFAESACAFELHGLSDLIAATIKRGVATHSFMSLSEQPVAIRDLSFWVKPGVTVSTISDKLRLLEIPELQRVELIDKFNQTDKLSLTIRLLLQSKQKTLTGEEIAEITGKIVSELDKLGLSLR